MRTCQMRDARRPSNIVTFWPTIPAPAAFVAPPHNAPRRRRRRRPVGSGVGHPQRGHQHGQQLAVRRLRSEGLTYLSSSGVPAVLAHVRAGRAELGQPIIVERAGWWWASPVPAHRRAVIPAAPVVPPRPAAGDPGPPRAASGALRAIPAALRPGDAGASRLQLSAGSARPGQRRMTRWWCPGGWVDASRPGAPATPAMGDARCPPMLAAPSREARSGDSSWTPASEHGS